MTGQNISELLNSILLMSEILDLECYKKSLASHVVLGAHIDKGLGAVSSILVRNGTLMLGDFIVAGRNNIIKYVYNSSPPDHSGTSRDKSEAKRS